MDANTQFERAKSLHKQGDHASALHILIKLREQFPNDTNLIRAHVLSLTTLGRTEEARNLLYQKRVLLPAKMLDGLSRAIEGTVSPTPPSQRANPDSTSAPPPALVSADGEVALEQRSMRNAAIFYVPLLGGVELEQKSMRIAAFLCLLLLFASCSGWILTFKPEPRLTEYLEKEIELNEIDLYGAVANQNSTDNRVLKIQASSNKADEYKAEGQKIYDSIPEGEVIAVRVGTNAPHSVGRAAEANEFFAKSDQIEDRVRRNMQVVAQSLGPSLIGTTDEQVWTRNVRLRAELEALYKRHPYYYYESQGEITTRAPENLILGCLSLLLAWFNYHLLRELGFWNYVAVRYVRLVKKKFV